MKEILIIIGMIILLILILYLILRSPYHYPYFDYQFDVSGKRQPNIWDLIDDLINQNKGIEIFKKHYDKVAKWREQCQKSIESNPLRGLRQKQFEKCLDDENMFYFEMTRKQTRYKQSNYQRTSYKVDVTDKEFSCNYAALERRYIELKKINFECTLKEYNSKSQRKLMTKALRKQIMERDNYRCQICGKYMPDEVGLHIDHIIPISKGGKTVASNLQVLCSKCNGRKSNS